MPPSVIFLQLQQFGVAHPITKYTNSLHSEQITPKLLPTTAGVQRALGEIN